MSTKKTTPKEAAQRDVQPTNDAQQPLTIDKPANYPLAKLRNPSAVTETTQADAVRAFVENNNLSATLKGREGDRPFVNVEGWQYAGELRGLTSVVQYCKRIYNGHPTEILYEARVTVRSVESGRILGAGVAVCSSLEKNDRVAQEFAICSMAQTRATGKAFRNILGWLISSAGFAATPREEMDQFLAAQVVGTTAADMPLRARLENGKAITEVAPAEQPDDARPEAPRRLTAGALQPEGQPANAPILPREAKPAPVAAAQDPRPKLATAQVTSVINTMRGANPAVHMKPGDLLPTGKEGTAIDPAQELSAENRFADLDQKQQIIGLLAKPYFTTAERTKVLLNIHKASAARCSEAFTSMQAQYEQRHRLNPELEDGAPDDQRHPALRD